MYYNKSDVTKVVQENTLTILTVRESKSYNEAKIKLALSCFRETAPLVKNSLDIASRVFASSFVHCANTLSILEFCLTGKTNHSLPFSVTLLRKDGFGTRERKPIRQHTGLCSRFKSFYVSLICCNSLTKLFSYSRSLPGPNSNQKFACI